VTAMVLVWDDLLRFWGVSVRVMSGLRSVNRFRSSLRITRFPFIVPELRVVLGNGSLRPPHD
jgi:hypothetical protein